MLELEEPMDGEGEDGEVLLLSVLLTDDEPGPLLVLCLSPIFLMLDLCFHI